MFSIAGITILQDRFRSVVFLDGADLFHHPVHGLVPADPLELAFAPFARAQQRVLHPVGAVDLLDVREALQTEVPLRDRMIRISFDLDHLFVLDVDEFAAGVVAIVGAAGLDDPVGDHFFSADPDGNVPLNRVPVQVLVPSPGNVLIGLGHGNTSVCLKMSTDTAIR